MFMPRRQQGQSLVVLVVLLAALLGALWWTVEAGSAVNEKQRLANSADAALARLNVSVRVCAAQCGAIESAVCRVRYRADGGGAKRVGDSR
ncbi:MAG: pilus assembly protein TadG-related protein [Steroidobacteraceae bacterium]